MEGELIAILEGDILARFALGVTGLVGVFSENRSWWSRGLLIGEDDEENVVLASELSVRAGVDGATLTESRENVVVGEADLTLGELAKDCLRRRRSISSTALFSARGEGLMMLAALDGAFEERRNFSYRPLGLASEAREGISSEILAFIEGLEVGFVDSSERR